MKLGSFLFGGLVGAAAVVYLNNKSKSMLLSAFSSNNQSVGNMMDKAKDRFNGASDSASTSPFDSSKHSSNKTASSSSNAFKKEDAFSTNSSGLGKVEEIIKKDPKLNETVQDILAQNNNEKETFHTQ
ncbi:hypothetical protein [Paenibacillus radicis (ex Xue et al. 2023)]|uniref:YtxH domain-containing protein n=1 Tax=Paenibacillus radicis (ex Xue et al. 2023) TaxID=2972489 RepID=A0ABT1YMN0_9BACL|nr:hypothetical protein [Paenibacillus radicis (ex Xue et al. 2023)]MCR8634431.1 hypothetical protein [Paenibacillus radicis (ex Xue et al. 2023)]